MKKFALLILICNTIIAHSQDLAFDKVVQSLGKNPVSAKAISADPKGNICLIGQFSGEATIEASTLSSEGLNDVFLAKYDKDCKLSWIKQIGSKDNVNGHSIAYDSLCNIYISGSFGKTCNFGDKSIKAGSYQENFIAKYSPEGNVLWIKHIKGNTKACKTFLAIGPQAQVFYAGSFYKTLDFADTLIQSENSADIFLSELDQDGKIIQIQQIRGSQDEILNDLICTRKGEVYLTGWFNKSIQFDSIRFESHGQEDIFIAKYKDMNFKWARAMGSAYADYGNKMTFDKYNLYLGGSFSDEISIENTTLTSEGALDAFICSYNFDGDINWASRFGSYANEYLNALATNPQGQIYLGGNFKGEISQDTSNIKSNGLINDLFMAKYTESGEFIWAKNYGGLGADYTVNLFLGKQNYFYLIGEFGKDIRFGNQELENTNGSNYFISRFYDCFLNKKLELPNDTSFCGTEYLLKGEDGFTAYQWSNGSTEKNCLAYASGTYSLIATDSVGCQSTDEITLILNPLPALGKAAPGYLCPGSSILLDAGSAYQTYSWNTGEKTRKITVYEPGEYQVSVMNQYQCSGTDSFVVAFPPQPDFKLGNDRQVGIGEEIILGPAGKFESYNWSDNSANSSLNIDTKLLNPGIYTFWINVEDSFACSYTDTIRIELTEKGTNEFELANLVSTIQPNPSDGKFELRLENLPEKSDLHFWVYTINGILIRTEDTAIDVSHFFTHEFSLQSLSKGSYLLKIQIGDQFLSKEFIIQ